ncbi:hypothetical protein [Paracoccus cavernae]|uniref:hypothetical protein n=1 Tax=Paracoccus cavernae TaxID=1571207 RepID=UPI003619EF96
MKDLFADAEDRHIDRLAQFGQTRVAEGRDDDRADTGSAAASRPIATTPDAAAAISCGVVKSAGAPVFERPSTTAASAAAICANPVMDWVAASLELGLIRTITRPPSAFWLAIAVPIVPIVRPATMAQAVASSQRRDGAFGENAMAQFSMKRLALGSLCMST